MRRSLHIALLAAALTALLLSAGCGLTAPNTAPGSTTSEAQANADIKARRLRILAAQVQPMAGEDRAKALPAGFPIEVPVAAGMIVGAVTQPDQGNGMWVYELRVSAPVESVAAWYRVSYENRDWHMTQDETVSSGTPSSMSMVMEKGAGARSVLAVDRIDARTCRVRATVGLSAPATGSY